MTIVTTPLWGSLPDRDELVLTGELWPMQLPA